MISYIERRKTRLPFRIISFFICLSFTLSLITPPQSFADTLPMNLPPPGTMVSLSPAFTPPALVGIKINPENPLQFDFILDNGDSGKTGEELRSEAERSIRYFLAALTIPEDELWVNLSPYEKDRIVPEKLGQTDLGRDLLAQDYLLKQLTASLVYPENDLGKEFWTKVYAKAQELYGTTEIPVNTFNKVWIYPDKAAVYESGDTAVIVESHLKVVLEEDYLALEKNQYSHQSSDNSLQSKTNNRLTTARPGDLDQRAGDDRRLTTEISKVSSPVIREIIIPAIEKEVNTAKNFAQLRQVYNSVILATWFKMALKESLLGQVYVDKGKILGVDLNDKTAKDKIYQQYLQAFKKGVYNYIKEDIDQTTKQPIPRKYFSGGTSTKAPDGSSLTSRMGRITTAAELELTPDAQASFARLAHRDLSRVPTRLTEPNEPAPDIKAQSPADKSMLASIDTAMLTQWTPVVAPDFLASSLGQYGLTVQGVEVAGLKPQKGATTEDVFRDSDNYDAVSISVSQALGSILFAGQGTNAKTVADANAVFMGHQQLMDITKRNPKVAYASIASEGIRDGSVGTPLGRIYWNGYEGGYHNSADINDFKAQLTMLRREGIKIKYYLDDGLENTAANQAKEAVDQPTDAWSVTAFQDDRGEGSFRYLLDETKTRRVSIMANAPQDANLNALDSPRQVLQKLAKANGIEDLNSDEGRTFAKKIIMAVLGERKAEDKKESSGQRHSFYIDEIAKLEREYGVRAMIFGDGDLMPGLLAASGIPLDEKGSIVVKFGRSGLVEAEIMDLAASQIEGAQMASRKVSNATTKDRVTPQTALQVEDGLLKSLRNDFDYPADSFTTERTMKDMEGKSVVAMTAVTGADPKRYGSDFAEQLKRVTFNENNGTVTTHTFLVTEKGVFAVRTTLKAEDLKAAKSAILVASPEAKAYADAAMLGELDRVIAEDWEVTDPYAGKTFANAVERIMAHPDFANEDPRVLANMRAFYNQGTLAGTGQLVIFPIDQVLEHDWFRTHLSNFDGSDKWWQQAFAFALGMSGYAAPYGTIKLIAPKWAKHLPLIAKINNSVSSQAGPKKEDMHSAMTSNIAELAKLGVRAIGFTIYAGSDKFDAQYEELRQVVAEAKKHGMAVVVWSYPRGGRPEAMPTDHETALDVTIAAVKLAVRAGANIVKIKAPSAVFRDPEKKKWLESQQWFKDGGYDLEKQADRMQIVSLFTNGRTQIFSGGPAREGALTEIEELQWGGASGNIIGRNSFKPKFPQGKDFVLRVIALNMAKAKGLENYANIDEFRKHAYETILPELQAAAPDELKNFGPGFDIHNNPTGATYADEVARMLTEEFAAERITNPALLSNLERIYRHGPLGGSGNLFITPYDEQSPVAGVNAYMVPVADVESALRKSNGTPIIAKITPTPYTGGDAADYGNPPILADIERLAKLGVAAVSYELHIDPGLGYNAQMTELRAIMNKAQEYGLPTVIQSYPTGNKQNALDRVTASADIAFDAGAHIIIIRQPNGEILDEKNVRKELDNLTYGVPYKTTEDQMRIVKWSLSGGRRKAVVTVEGTDDILRNVAATLVGGGNGINLDKVLPPEIAQKLLAVIETSTKKEFTTTDALLENAFADNAMLADVDQTMQRITDYISAAISVLEAKKTAALDEFHSSGRTGVYKGDLYDIVIDAPPRPTRYRRGGSHFTDHELATLEVGNETGRPAREVVTYNADYGNDHVIFNVGRMTLSSFDEHEFTSGGPLPKDLDLSPEKQEILVGEVRRLLNSLSVSGSRFSVRKTKDPSRSDRTVLRISVRDQAQLRNSETFIPVKSPNETPVGGIDLSNNRMNLQIKRDGNGIPLPVNMQQIDKINIDGFLPVIINIAPMTNLPLLLGISDLPLEQKTSKSNNTEKPAPAYAYLKDQDSDLVLSER